MKFGHRLYGIDERRRTAIGSMVNGTIGGHSKIGMPVVETRRMPLVSQDPGVYRATATSQTGVTPEAGLELLELPTDTTDTTGGVVTRYSIGKFELHELGTYLVELSISESTSIGGVAGVHVTSNPALDPGDPGTTFVADTGGFYFGTGPDVRNGIIEVSSLPLYVMAGITLGDPLGPTSGTVVGPGTYLEITTP